ncbi:MAG: hypothetical protein HYY14_01135 [Candidatus Omnitrophica bacterium]|nr:hypothetical protein [Candidatus Omnitrophota bacterium]
MKAKAASEPAERLKEIEGQLEILKSELDYQKKHRDKLWEKVTELMERMQDAEVQININTRVLTYICVEHLGMTSKQLKKLLKRIEKETEEDRQIVMLEELFRKKSPPRDTRSGLDEQGAE